jgi:hypothetical protein
MSPRPFQRLGAGECVRDRLIDEVFACYLDWRAQSDMVETAYRLWSTAPPTEGALPFAAYRAALDLEECAAMIYRQAVDRLRQPLEGEQHVAAAQPRVARA